MLLQTLAQQQEPESESEKERECEEIRLRVPLDIREEYYTLSILNMTFGKSPKTYQDSKEVASNLSIQTSSHIMSYLICTSTRKLSIGLEPSRIHELKDLSLALTILPDPLNTCVFGDIRKYKHILHFINFNCFKLVFEISEKEKQDSPAQAGRSSKNESEASERKKSFVVVSKSDSKELLPGPRPASRSKQEPFAQQDAARLDCQNQVDMQKPVTTSTKEVSQGSCEGRPKKGFFMSRNNNNGRCAAASSEKEQFEERKSPVPIKGTVQQTVDKTFSGLAKLREIGMQDVKVRSFWKSLKLPSLTDGWESPPKVAGRKDAARSLSIDSPLNSCVSSMENIASKPKLLSKSAPAKNSSVGATPTPKTSKAEGKHYIRSPSYGHRSVASSNSLQPATRSGTSKKSDFIVSKLEASKVKGQ